MENIESLRDKINEIDKQMAILFEKRMEIVKEIANLKKEANLPIYDQSRETFLLLRNTSYIKDDNIRRTYYELLLKQFELSKKMQEEILHLSK